MDKVIWRGDSQRKKYEWATSAWRYAKLHEYLGNANENKISLHPFDWQKWRMVKSQCCHPCGLTEWWWEEYRSRQAPHRLGDGYSISFATSPPPPVCFEHDRYSAVLCESGEMGRFAAYLSCRGFLLFKCPSPLLLWDWGWLKETNGSGSRS